MFISRKVHIDLTWKLQIRNTNLHIVHVINLGLPRTNHLCFLLAPPSGLGHKFFLHDINACHRQPLSTISHEHNKQLCVLAYTLATILLLLGVVRLSYLGHTLYTTYIDHKSFWFEQNPSHLLRSNCRSDLEPKLLWLNSPLARFDSYTWKLSEMALWNSGKNLWPLVLRTSAHIARTPNKAIHKLPDY